MKIKIGFLCILFTFYILLTGILFFINSIYLNVNVVLYSSLKVCFVSFLLILLFFRLSKAFYYFNSFEKLLISALLVSTGYVFSISIPTVIDRSLSIYLLEKIQQRGGVVPVTSLEDIFTVEYVKEHQLIQIRLTEQIESGTLVIRGECVHLTKFGDSLAKMTRYFRRNLLPKNRLIGSSYNDSLTDPFRDSAIVDSKRNIGCREN